MGSSILHRFLLGLAVAAPLVPAAAETTENLLVNGDAELQSCTRDWTAQTSVPGWQVLRGAASVLCYSAFDFTGQSRMYGFGVGSQLDSRADGDQIAGAPLVVFLAHRSQVDILRDGRLLSSRFYDAGNQTLDTAYLPQGADAHWPLLARQLVSLGRLPHRAAFAPLCKWSEELIDARRLPELVRRAFQVATSGRPGPVVLSLPEDVLASRMVADPFHLLDCAMTSEGGAAVLITSRAQVVPVADEADQAVLVRASAHAKCERCWHWRADVDADPAHPGLCGRCVSNLFGTGEARTCA